MKRVRAMVSIVAVTAAMLAPATTAQADSELGDRLARSVTPDGLNRHLIAIQRIADRNGGHRADPSNGFRETISYVENTMRTAGFDVRVQEFTYDRSVTDKSSLTAGTAAHTPTPMGFSVDTPAGGVTGPLVVVPTDADTGCQAADYAGQNPAGSVVLLFRGGCTFTQKQLVAAEVGAKAVVVYNHSIGAAMGFIDEAQAKVPIVMVGSVAGAALGKLAGTQTTLEVRRHVEPTVTRNVIAETHTGRKDNVITLGAHADSAPTAPGMNDNGSSLAALLELGKQLGGSPKVKNAVRFGFWGAEPRHSGSTPYLESLSFEQQLDIALYLDVAPIGSGNGGYFVFDGDNSTGAPGPMPYGSDKIEQAFRNYFGRVGIPTEEAPAVGQGDYPAFIAAGIPTGGPFAGIPHIKSAAQAAKWGGTAGLSFDPCNHAPCDNLGTVNRGLIDKNADAVAYLTGTYATSTEDVNGVPARARRAAARAAYRTTTVAPAGESR
nr:M28 family peptidase [Kibdelosporangium sp. MJ126-NF4]CEL18505.1 Aminopeptidase Y (Arg, Lys, Leu preference) [Kibdelosporangium sp. MJ126-NF4]CTQ97989.1 Aminopeptidase Y (Arg, Lys, Leu preference) (EC 3.4.11.15) [Kibdelosporangium sp. MJ126-NF4]